MNLYNPSSKNIYLLDSINLIIGNNGAGKTTLIKSIIRDLTDFESPDEFIADGVTERLGIVYYTATSFYNPIKVKNGSLVSFVDASKAQHEKQNFLDSSLEYLEIAKVLGLERSIKSIQSFDLEEIAFNLAKLNSFLSASNLGRYKHGSQEINDALRNYRAVDIQYNRLNRLILNSHSELQSIPHHFSESVLRERGEELDRLNLELEYIAKDVIDARQRAAKIFLHESGPIDNNACINWIASAILLNEGKLPPQAKKDLATRIYQGSIDEVDKASPLGRRFLPTRLIVSDFFDVLKETKSGSVKIKRNGIDISVNTSRLIKSAVDSRIIQSAHKIGLLRIGFDSMSSGQAAIMHQMISISQSIKQLISMGKKNILLFIDEGDLLLHLNWQREYISLLDNRLSRFKSKRNKLDSLQVVIASHSPLLTSDILRDSITRLDEGTDLPSFGAPIQKIINYSFGTPSIGLLAQKVIEKLDRKGGKFSAEDIEIIEQIDDAFIRDHLKEKAQAC